MHSMKVLRSAILIALLSLEIITVISEEKNVAVAHNGIANSIASLDNGYHNRYIRKVRESDTLLDQLPAIGYETLQTNKKVVKKRNTDRFGRSWGKLGIGGHGKFGIGLGGGGGLRGGGFGGFGINLEGGGVLGSEGYSGINMYVTGGGGVGKERLSGIGGGGELGTGAHGGIEIYLKGGKRIGSGGPFGIGSGGVHVGINAKGVGKFGSGGYSASAMSLGAASLSADRSSGYRMGSALVGNNAIVEKKKLVQAKETPEVILILV